MTATAYPLTWPDNIPRTEKRAVSQFKTSLSGAVKNVRGSLTRFSADSSRMIEGIVISSNVTLGVDKPTDPGVAVWFTWDEMSVCIAVDRYPKVEDNLQAIHHIIEARRTELRHGGLHIVRATFTGFMALPSPERKKTWREVFGFDPREPVISADIETAYRELAKTRHPDSETGSHEKMTELNLAKEEALREIGG